MKKYFVFIVVFFLIGGMSVQAQFKFGIKAGVNLSSISLNGLDERLLDNIKTENLTGFQVGPMVEGMFTMIGFDLSVLYSQHGFKLPINIDGTNVSLTEEYKMNTLQIPVNLKFKMPLVPKLLKAYGAVGPYVNLNLDKKLKDQIETKGFGAGLNFGLGAELLSHLQVGVNYQLGLTDDYNSFKFVVGDLKGKPRMWSITATYLF